jgi:hypothetical protein
MQKADLGLRGYNGDGETGFAQGSIVPQPRFIPALEGKKFERVGAGGRHSFAISGALRRHSDLCVEENGT